MMIDVALLDADPAARGGVEEILVKTPGVRRLVSVGTLADLLGALAGARRPDLVMMDIDLGGGPRPSAVARLTAYAPVLVVSQARRACHVLAAIRAGARGYLTKPTRPDLLASAVNTVAAGGFLISADLVGLLREALPAEGPASHAAWLSPRLSPREEQTLKYVAEGFTHAQIATRLGVSTTTVDTYIQRIRSKLGVGNKAQLALAAMSRAAAWDGDLRQRGG
jgi:two-component system, NarL family, nitrate/nitrite response regulator NarL